MSKGQTPNMGSYLFFIIWLLWIDQVSKYLVRMYEPQVNFGWASLSYTTNTGAIFGFFKGMNTLFIVLSLVAVGLLVYYYRQKETNQTNQAALAMVLAGIIGNLIDRLWLGHVVDFIGVGVWPTFNIADSCITIGVIWLLYHELFKKQQ